MPSDWYYRGRGMVVGPLSASQLRKHIKAGHVFTTTPVRRGKEAKWTPAGRVKGLKLEVRDDPRLEEQYEARREELKMAPRRLEEQKKARLEEQRLEELERVRLEEQKKAQLKEQKRAQLEKLCEKFGWPSHFALLTEAQDSAQLEELCEELGLSSDFAGLIVEQLLEAQLREQWEEFRFPSHSARRTKPILMRCQNCEGKGSYRGQPSGARGLFQNTHVKCSDCGGTGQVPCGGTGQVFPGESDLNFCHHEPHGGPVGDVRCRKCGAFLGRGTL